jgi:hypothetical protein
LSYANIPPNLHDIFKKQEERVDKLERSNRFTVPNVVTDPTVFRNGDMWLNTTTNTLKIVDSLGVVRTITMV